MAGPSILFLADDSGFGVDLDSELSGMVGNYEERGGWVVTLMLSDDGKDSEVHEG